MKKALLAASLLTVGVAAHAQSSVTLYGRLDAGLEYMTGVPTTSAVPGGAATASGHRFRAESGDWGTSLWGMKGVEDLGGGNKAVFQLEGSFNTMTGAGPGGGGLFNRWATVGIANDQFGTFLLGRELFISNGVWDFDPFGQSNWSSASLVRGRNWPQSSNNVSYQSPKIAGFDFYGQYALSNATNWNGNGTTPQGREAGAQVTYTTSLFQIRGLYDEIRNPANGGLYGPGTSATNPGNISGGVFAASREYTAAKPNQISGSFGAAARMSWYSLSASASLPDHVKIRARHARTSMSLGVRATSRSTIPIAAAQSFASAHLRTSACHVRVNCCPQADRHNSQISITNLTTTRALAPPYLGTLVTFIGELTAYI